MSGIQGDGGEAGRLVGVAIMIQSSSQHQTLDLGPQRQEPT